MAIVNDMRPAMKKLRAELLAVFERFCERDACWNAQSFHLAVQDVLTELVVDEMFNYSTENESPFELSEEWCEKLLSIVKCTAGTHDG